MARNWGMVPVVAASGAEALELVRREGQFDIAVVDLQMPGMSGLELAEELHKLVPELPVVITSALGVPVYSAEGKSQPDDHPTFLQPASKVNEQREGMRQLGIKNVLFKPVKPAALQNALLEHLDTRGAMVVADTPIAPIRTRESIDSDMGNRHPLRILLAEDNLTNQKVTLRLLKRLGYEANVVADGSEAVKAANEQCYDVILMDIQMPEMDGLEATRQIRKDLPASGQPHIIAMTAAAMQLDREKCLEAGMDDFVAKPTRLEDLAGALHHYLSYYTPAG
jgi:CheY-like chemotaxis protein